MSPVCGRPLFGRTVLVTRAADRAGEFTSLLEAQGARVLECPTIRLEPAPRAELDAALENLADFDWLILTSASAVQFFFARLRALGLDARALARCRICAVGPKTAAALAAHGLRADLVPSDHKGEGVVAAFADLAPKGARVLFPRADKARDVIPEGLAALGVTEADIPRLAGTTLKDACVATNPRAADRRDIEWLFREAL